MFFLGKIWVRPNRNIFPGWPLFFKLYKRERSYPDLFCQCILKNEKNEHDEKEEIRLKLIRIN